MSVPLIREKLLAIKAKASHAQRRVVFNFDFSKRSSQRESKRFSVQRKVETVKASTKLETPCLNQRESHGARPTLVFLSWPLQKPDPL
jgi:hypothetical protein